MLYQLDKNCYNFLLLKQKNSTIKLSTKIYYFNATTLQTFLQTSLRKFQFSEKKKHKILILIIKTHVRTTIISKLFFLLFNDI